MYRCTNIRPDTRYFILFYFCCYFYLFILIRFCFAIYQRKECMYVCTYVRLHLLFFPFILLFYFYLLFILFFFSLITYAKMSVCMCIYVLYQCLRMHVYLYVNVYICTYIRPCKRIFSRLYINVRNERMRVSMSVCVYNWSHDRLY